MLTAGSPGSGFAICDWPGFMRRLWLLPGEFGLGPGSLEEVAKGRFGFDVMPFFFRETRNI